MRVFLCVDINSRATHDNLYYNNCSEHCDVFCRLKLTNQRAKIYFCFKVIIIVIELMFLCINMFLALLRAHFNPRYARAEINSESSQKHIYARERPLLLY